MWRITIFILASLSLVACVASVENKTVNTLPEPSPTFGLAGRGVFMEQTSVAYQRTQSAFNAAVVEATAQSRQTQEARAWQNTQVAATSTARVADLQFRQTADAATVTWKSTQVAIKITEDAATYSATSTQSTALLNATVAARAAERRESSDALWGNFLAAFAIVLCALVLWYVRQTGRNIASRFDPKRDPDQVRVWRTAGGTLLVIPLAEGGFDHRLLPAASVDVAANDLDADQFEGDEHVAPEPNDVPIYSGGKLVGFYNRNESQKQDEQAAEDRKFLLWFLRRCIEVAGRDSTIVPPHDKLGMATETWVRATNMLSGAVEKKRGRNGGTWLVGNYSKLIELWLAIGERRYVPRSNKPNVIDNRPPPLSEDVKVAQETY